MRRRIFLDAQSEALNVRHEPYVSSPSSANLEGDTGYQRQALDLSQVNRQSDPLTEVAVRQKEMSARRP